MSYQNTQGDWIAEDNIVESVDENLNGGFPVAVCRGPDGVANAKLIAALPKLLSACKRLLPYLSTQSDLLDHAAGNEGHASEYDMASVELRKALATVLPAGFFLADGTVA